MSKKAITVRVEQEILDQFNALKKHFNDHIEIGKVTNDDVATLAIKELAKNYLEVSNK